VTSGGGGSDRIGVVPTETELDAHKGKWRLADVLEVVKQVLARTEIDMARIARSVRDEPRRAVVGVLDASACREGCPEVLDGVTVGTESLTWFEIDPPDLDPPVYGQER
jgi:hypothetical protein